MSKPNAIERSLAYTNYIKSHIARVNYYYKRYKVVFQEVFKDEDINWEEVDEIIAGHDNSKFEPTEFSGYCDQFYPGDGTPEDEQEVNYNFCKAWLYHIHQNQHHPEFWVLWDNAKRPFVFDMPNHFIIEMVCDWCAMSDNNPDGINVWDWYNGTSKDKIMSNRTRAVTELLLKCVRDYEEKLIALEQINNMEHEEIQ